MLALGFGLLPPLALLLQLDETLLRILGQLLSALDRRLELLQLRLRSLLTKCGRLQALVGGGGLVVAVHYLMYPVFVGVLEPSACTSSYKGHSRTRFLPTPDG